MSMCEGGTRGRGVWEKRERKREVREREGWYEMVCMPMVC